MKAKKLVALLLAVLMLFSLCSFASAQQAMTPGTYRTSIRGYSTDVVVDVTVDETEYKLVHGAPVEEYEVCGARYANVEEFAVWKRWKGHELLIMDQVMIFGHTPTMQYQSNIPMEVLFDLDGLGIGIDCGSGFSDHPLYPYAPYGRLACLRLDDMKVFYSEEKLEERCKL